jgi:predicted anti-sigma-YlaC factor YlaD
MDGIRFLPTKVHGVLDYLVGLALIFASNIFGFSDVGGAAVNVPRVLGVVLIIYALFTNYEWGAWKILPMYYHLIIDFLAAAFLALSPWIFGFHDEKNSAWLPHVIVGVVVILVVLVSQTTPGKMTTTRKKSMPAEE